MIDLSPFGRCAQHQISSKVQTQNLIAIVAHIQQEALNNVVKHASACRVTLTLSLTLSALLLDINFETIVMDNALSAR